MAMLYLTPILPLGPVSYMCGSTSMALSSFVIAKIASLPLMLLYVFVGASAGTLIADTKALENDSIFIVGGIILSLVMITGISHYIRKELMEVCLKTNRQVMSAVFFALVAKRVLSLVLRYLGDRSSRARTRKTNQVVMALSWGYNPPANPRHFSAGTPLLFLTALSRNHLPSRTTNPNTSKRNRLVVLSIPRDHQCPYHVPLAHHKYPIVPPSVLPSAAKTCGYLR